MSKSLGRWIANILVENQELLDLADEVLEAFLDFLEEKEEEEEQYIDMSFIDDGEADGWIEASETEDERDDEWGDE